jgi:hypothetical protein
LDAPTFFDLSRIRLQNRQNCLLVCSVLTISQRASNHLDARQFFNKMINYPLKQIDNEYECSDIINVKQETKSRVMKKQDNTPMWVYLAFASVETRRGALLIIWLNVLFAIYCLPWSQFITDVGWVRRVFLIDGWLWFAVMAAMTLWYWVSLKWIDSNDAWSKPIADSGQQVPVSQADES